MDRLARLDQHRVVRLAGDGPVVLESDELTGLFGHRRQPDALQRRCPHRLASKPLGVLGALCLDDEADTDEYTGHDLERNVIHASSCQVILDRGENVSSRKAPARHSANNVVAHYWSLSHRPAATTRVRPWVRRRIYAVGRDRPEAAFLQSFGGRAAWPRALTRTGEAVRERRAVPWPADDQPEEPHLPCPVLPDLRQGGGRDEERHLPPPLRHLRGRPASPLPSLRPQRLDLSRRRAGRSWGVDRRLPHRRRWAGGSHSDGSPWCLVRSLAYRRSQMQVSTHATLGKTVTKAPLAMVQPVTVVDSSKHYFG